MVNSAQQPSAPTGSKHCRLFTVQPASSSANILIRGEIPESAKMTTSYLPNDGVPTKQDDIPRKEDEAVFSPEVELRRLHAENTDGNSQLQIPVQALTLVLASVEHSRCRVQLLQELLSEDDQSTIAQANPVNKPTFACFPDLPVEIRKLIWTEYLKTPQVVGLTAGRHHHGQHSLSMKPNDKGIGLRSSGPLCSLLRTNRESREAALEVQKPFYTESGQVTPRLIINNKIDILWLLDLEVMGLFQSELKWAGGHQAHQFGNTRRQMPRIAIDFNCWGNDVLRSAGKWHIAKFMHNIKIHGIKEVNVVVGGFEAKHLANITLIDPRGCTCDYQHLFHFRGTSLNLTAGCTTWEDLAGSDSRLLHKRHRIIIEARQRHLATCKMT